MIHARSPHIPAMARWRLRKRVDKTLSAATAFRKTLRLCSRFDIDADDAFHGRGTVPGARGAGIWRAATSQRAWLARLARRRQTARPTPNRFCQRAGSGALPAAVFAARTVRSRRLRREDLPAGRRRALRILGPRGVLAAHRMASAIALAHGACPQH